MKEQSLLVSAIVPVYNKENTISTCIESLIQQDFYNFEIIIVDDGSTDKSYEICRKYEKRYGFVKVIHQQNKGVGAARNTALRVAQGMYYVFVDADDYVQKKYIRNLYDCAIENRCDIVCCDFHFCYKNEMKMCDTEAYNNQAIYLLDKMETILGMWYEGKIKLACWGKIFKAELWKNIIFKEVYCFEDYATTYKIFLKANKIMYYDKKLYNYVNAPNGLTNGFFKKKLEGMAVVREVLAICLKECPQLYKGALAKGVDISFSIICQMDEIYPEVYKDAVKFIKKHRKEVFFNPRVRLKSKVAILCSYISFRLVRIIYRQQLIYNSIVMKLRKYGV